MTSLSPSVNSPSGGGTFFTETVDMDDQEYLLPVLQSIGIFKPLRTIIPFGIQLVAFMALEIAAITLASIQLDHQSKCREYFALIYAHVALWFIALIVDQIARVKHYNLRMNGYLEFYNKVQLFQQAPIYIVSLWSTIILLIQAIMQYVYPNNFVDKCMEGGLLSPIPYICILLTVEFCVIAPVIICYIDLVRRFNQQRPPPDVQKEEWNACASADSFAQGEIGYRQLGDKVYDFIEKQADLIRHLKDHNARLGEKLMILNAQMHARSRTTTNN